jgi:hypothetical protein
MWHILRDVNNLPDHEIIKSVKKIMKLIYNLSEIHNVIFDFRKEEERINNYQIQVGNNILYPSSMIISMKGTGTINEVGRLEFNRVNQFDFIDHIITY